MESFQSHLFSKTYEWICQHHLQPGGNLQGKYADRVGVLPSQVNDFLDYWFELCFNIDLLFLVDILLLSFYKLLMLLDFHYRQVNLRVDLDLSRPENIWSLSCITPSLICCLECEIYTWSKLTVTVWLCMLDYAAMGVWISCFQKDMEHTHIIEKCIFLFFFSRSAAVSVEHQEP